MFSILVDQKKESKKKKRTARVYSLQSRHNTTPRRVGTRSRSRSCGHHPIAVDGVTSVLLAIHQSIRTLRTHRHDTIFFRRRGCRVTRTTGEGQGGGRGEGLRLMSVRGMSRERIHTQSRKPAETEEGSKIRFDRTRAEMQEVAI